MATLFGRKFSIQVDKLLVQDLRATFKVKKTLRKEPNTCEVQITNLSEQTRAGMKSKGAKVILQAGYEGFTEQIFSGDARLIQHRNNAERAEWTTEVRCGDGERSFQYDKISESFAPGTDVKEVLTKVIKAIKLDPGNALKQISGIAGSLTGGYVAHGRAFQELERLLKGRGFEFSVQDGRLQLLAEGETTTTVTVLSSINDRNTGLIGSPEFGTPDKKGGPTPLKAKSLLQPQIKAGGRVRLETRSKSFNGLYKAEVVEHEGDTAGGAWYTHLELLPVSG